MTGLFRKSTLGERARATAFALILVIILSYPHITSLSITNFTIKSSGIISYYRARPLHVEGRYIKDDTGKIVQLAGVHKHGYEDDPLGRWDGAWGEHNEAIIIENFQAMKSWGANEIRITERASFWLDNPLQNGWYHRDAIRDLLRIADEQGFYVIFCLFCMDSSAGWHGVPWGTTTIPTLDDFVSLWVDIATELKDYPNVLFELWNEVTQNQDAWFNGVQQTISAIRNVTDHIILVQWNWDVWANLYTGSTSDLSWVADPRIHGTNIIYSTHMYSDSRGFWEDIGEGVPRTFAYTYDDVKQAFQNELVDWVLNVQNKPLYIGEYGIGPYTLPPNASENAKNGLQILNEWGVSYNCMWWFSSELFALLQTHQPDWVPTEWGQIVMDAMIQHLGT